MPVQSILENNDSTIRYGNMKTKKNETKIYERTIQNLFLIGKSDRDIINLQLHIISSTVYEDATQRCNTEKKLLIQGE